MKAYCKSHISSRTQRVWMSFVWLYSQLLRRMTGTLILWITKEPTQVGGQEKTDIAVLWICTEPVSANLQRSYSVHGLSKLTHFFGSRETFQGTCHFYMGHFTKIRFENAHRWFKVQWNCRGVNVVQYLNFSHSPGSVIL